MCGLIQCQGGSAEPKLAEFAGSYYKTEFSHNGSNVECKYVAL